MKMMEKRIERSVGKQFTKMWEKAIENFQETLNQQVENMSNVSYEGRARSSSEISNNGNNSKKPSTDFSPL